MMTKQIFTLALFAGLAAIAAPQRYHGTYSLGESDQQPRLSDRNAAYVWHEGRTFYVALGATRPTNYGVRVDVLEGRISGADRRRTGSRRYNERDRFSDLWGLLGGQGIDRVSPDVIQYGARVSDGFDILRFRVDGGDEIRFDIRGLRGPIYVGGERGRRTNSDTVVIRLDDYRDRRDRRDPRYRDRGWGR